jgi:hypothetical protein
LKNKGESNELIIDSLLDNGHHQHLNFQQKNILNYVWTFHSSEKATVLDAGKHSWPFELLLPGNLPQTLLSDIGNISYWLTATIDKPGFIQHTITKKRNICILRCIMRFDQSLIISNTWADKLAYDISVPSRTYAFNDTMPISIHLQPIAQHLKVYAINIVLKEYATYTANGQSKSDSRVVRSVRIDHPFSDHCTQWHKTVPVTVPSLSIFANADGELIRIRHRLKFSIALVNADGHLSELRCASKIVIIESFALAEEFSTLPAYHEMWRSAQCQEEPIKDCPGSSHSARTSIDEEDLTSEPIFWHGMDLGKVPSYHSVANQDFCNITFPPSYDTCV